MRLPNGDQAIIDERKLWGYILNPQHPHGATHAFLFDRLLAINLTNWKALRAELARAGREEEATPGQPSSFGRKFEVRSILASPRGSYTILSVWIIRASEALPRLVTAHIV